MNEGIRTQDLSHWRIGTRWYPDMDSAMHFAEAEMNRGRVLLWPMAPGDGWLVISHMGLNLN